MDGGDRAGFMQAARDVDAVLITSTMGKCSATGAWVDFEVISSEVLIKAVTAPGLVNASLLDSGTTFAQNAVFACSKITMIQLATGIAEGKVIAHKKVLL
jgi:hypothetical protein